MSQQIREQAGRLHMSNDQERPDPALDALGERVAAMKARRAQRDGPAHGGPARGDAGLGVGLRVAVELAAAVAVGGVLGYLLDGWLGTRPWLMVVFLMLGFGAGFLTVYRTAAELDRQAKARKAETMSGKKTEDRG